MELATVVIPVYKDSLTFLEKKALTQVNLVLSDFTIIVIKPESLNLSSLQEEFPDLKFVSFDDSFFRSIASYNRLMLSAAFYKRFLDFKYILIYQLDAYVFRDELTEWCNKEYDYAGAPWPRKSVYRLPLIKKIVPIILWYKMLRRGACREFLYDKIGNGGFSLRNVKACYEATIIYREKIDFYLSQSHSSYYNEDVFWATEIPDFVYPSQSEAMRFSFEKYPKFCYNNNNKKLPFGCHAWYKGKMKEFWRPIIGF